MSDAATEPGQLPLEPPREGIRRAIVLSGGGARGAYEAGVLAFLLHRLPQRLGFVPRFDVYAGTSVGAVHACFLAAHADRPDAGVEELTEIWRRMSFSRVYCFGISDAISFSRTLFEFVRGTSIETDERPERIHGLLNTEPLERLVVENIPWRRVRANVRRGVFEALCVSATEIGTGRTVVFVDNRERRVPSWTRDPQHVARPSRIGPVHALAAAAIPLLFPAVRLGGTYYCDGALRQPSPLAPALRLGSNRVLAIGLRRPPDASLIDPRLEQERLEQFHSAGYLFGKVLDALLIDRLEHDLAHMRVINTVLSAGVEAYGPEFLEKVQSPVTRTRGLGFQIVEDIVVSPSEDLGAIAAQHVQRMRAHPSGSWIGRLCFRTLTRGAPEGEADLMSYLLFEGAYARDLIELGLADAQRREEDLARFFLS